MSEDPLFPYTPECRLSISLNRYFVFSESKNNIELQRNKIQLYCNQVFVTDSVEGIVPEFLTYYMA